MPQTHRPVISIVTPCFNEEGNVQACAAEVARVMADDLPAYDYEHIFSDNASTDRTVERLRDIAAADDHVKVLVNSRNVGPFRNIANGLRYVSGDLVVPMIPADLQDPPAKLPEMVAKLGPAFDVIYGVRGKRREPLSLRIARWGYYRVLRLGGGTTPPPNAGEFMLVRRHVIESINSAGGSYPYIRGLVAQTNPAFDTVSYAWGERSVGKSRNSVPDLVDQALNGIISTAKTPIRWALLLGMLLSVVGIGTAIANFILFVVGDTSAPQGIPTLIVGMFFFGGLQLFFTGLIGEYVVSIHSAARPEPAMFVRERINFDDDAVRHADQ